MGGGGGGGASPVSFWWCVTLVLPTSCLPVEKVSWKSLTSASNSWSCEASRSLVSTPRKHAPFLA